MTSLNHYLGKKISVEINDRDINGKVIWNKFTKVIGTCNQIGHNCILDQKQVNIGRTPFFIDNWDRVQLV